MKFEWDSRKSNANRDKNGIDFESAKALWVDENRIEIEAPHPIEERRILIAHSQGNFGTAVFTIREESTMRLISVRRSRKKEVEVYEKERIG